MSLDDKYLRWRCEDCGEAHEDEDDAKECCPTEIKEGFACPICYRFHLDDEDAIECCGFELDAPHPPPTADELEAAGQQRLNL